MGKKNLLLGNSNGHNTAESLFCEIFSYLGNNLKLCPCVLKTVLFKANLETENFLKKHAGFHCRHASKLF